MFMCYQNQKYSKTTHLSSRTFAMGIKDGSWPACNRVKHLSFTSTFEQKKEELKSPDKTNEQMRSPDVYKSSHHLPLCATCAAFAQQLTPFLGSATAMPFVGLQGDGCAPREPQGPGELPAVVPCPTHCVRNEL